MENAGCLSFLSSKQQDRDVPLTPKLLEALREFGPHTLRHCFATLDRRLSNTRMRPPQSGLVQVGLCGSIRRRSGRRATRKDVKLTITWKARGIRNLHKGRFAFERFRHMSVDLRPEALRVGALGGI